jgi:hypothetical protein
LKLLLLFGRAASLRCPPTQGSKRRVWDNFGDSVSLYRLPYKREKERAGGAVVWVDLNGLPSDIITCTEHLSVVAALLLFATSHIYA